jgi:hypothetical protein
MANYVIKEADMRKRVVAASSAGIACLVLSFGAGTASALERPGELENVLNANRGASAAGPHCHFVEPAEDSHFETIVSGAAHEAHLQTESSSNVFDATVCG